MADKSLFIVIEGLDGSGKTSVSRRLVNILNAENQGKTKLTYEPHDPSCAGLFIRQVLMKKIRQFSPRALALAFAANRLDHCEREINPWLDAPEDEQIIICDRYYLSSLVYQSSPDFSFESVWELNEKARKPDIIFFLDVPNEVCQERMHIRNEAKELFEENLEETRQKFREAIAYLKANHSDSIVEIDASGSIDEVAGAILEEVRKIRPDVVPDRLLHSVSPTPGEAAAILNGDPFTLEKAVKEMTLDLHAKTDAAGSHDKELLNEVEARLGKLDAGQLGSLFLDYIKKLEITVSGRLPEAEADAYGLEYIMPGNIALRGVALIIRESQRYDVILRTAPDIPGMSDFMFVFAPGPSELVTRHYERDKIAYHTEIPQEGLFPSTQLVTQRELASAILEVAKRTHLKADHRSA